MLLDHFHPPLSKSRHPHSFLMSWAVCIAKSLNEELPKGWFAVPHIRIESEPSVKETFVVHVQTENGGIAAAIALVSPAEKKDAESRELFVSRYFAWLKEGRGLVIVDIVTISQATLHHEIIDRLEYPNLRIMECPLFAASYMPVGNPFGREVEIHDEPLAIGGRLPIVPLYLKNGRLMGVDLQATYQEALKAVRIHPDGNE